ncbi:hypothetical protein CHLRE_01g004750v5 [Chlamydomonas reinhardtii]|uniref:EF-hand domain-containing protein n=1 Tax=Chlamydomonas reinhardtii TaxID=3055 RepID=A0A2K3E537_CHLRE|nr:uncharacterized protein CHLRE_01g004750v5 [Chlamydomonas reinhardtii]PNW87857.1 hypothetical protein CHLRE_01g004750v5 [Chlamydomonas reinhardtii]
MAFWASRLGRSEPLISRCRRSAVVKPVAWKQAEEPAKKPVSQPTPRVAELPAAAPATSGANARSKPHAPRQVTMPLRNGNPRRTETELVLDQAQRDLAELCNDDAADKDSCWRVVDYFTAKRKQYEQHCDLGNEKGEHEAAACMALNNLEKFARENMAAGSVKVFETNLRIMQRQEEKRRLQQQQGAASSTAPAIPPPMTSEEAAARVALIRLFHTLDRNQDGRLSMLEFQEGMERLCASELTDDDIRMISDALGVHGGYLDIDAFMDVLESSAYLQQAAVQGRTAHASAGMAANNAYLRHHQPVPHISHTQHVTHTMPHTQQGGVEGPGSGSGGQAAGPKSPAKGGPIPPRNL